MSFNGVSAYADFLPTASQATILLNAFYIREPDYDGDIYMLRNGQSSYVLLYNLNSVTVSRMSCSYIQYWSTGSAGSRYQIENGTAEFNLSQVNMSYIYQASSDLLGGNYILASGYDDHVTNFKIGEYSFLSCVLIGVILLFTWFVQFFKKIIF